MDWKSLAEIIGAICAVLSIYWLAVISTIRATKESFALQTKAITGQLDELKKELTKERNELTARIDKLDADVRRQREEMLTEYIRREEWTERIGAISIRLDQIWEWITKLRIKVTDGN